MGAADGTLRGGFHAVGGCAGAGRGVGGAWHGRGLVAGLSDAARLAFSPQGSKDAISQPSLATQPDQLPSPYTPLLQDSLSGQPTSPKV